MMLWFYKNLYTNDGVGGRLPLCPNWRLDATALTDITKSITAGEVKNAVFGINP